MDDVNMDNVNRQSDGYQNNFQHDWEKNIWKHINISYYNRFVQQIGINYKGVQKLHKIFYLSIS